MAGSIRNRSSVADGKTAFSNLKECNIDRVLGAFGYLKEHTYSYLFFFFLLIGPPPSSPLFPYTTLSRSVFSMIPTVPIWLSAPAGRKVPACFPLVRIVLSLSGKAVCSTQSRLTLVQLAASAPSSSRNLDRKSTRLNSSHGYISYAVFFLK